MAILTIILTVLKTIGIVLAVVLGLVLLLVCLVLFAPVRYAVSGSKDGTAIDGRAKVSWLGPVVTAVADFTRNDAGENAFSYCVKVLFFTVVPKKEGKGGDPDFDEEDEKASGKEADTPVKDTEKDQTAPVKALPAPEEDVEAGDTVTAEQTRAGSETRERQGAPDEEDRRSSREQDDADEWDDFDEAPGKKSFSQRLDEFGDFLGRLPERLEELADFIASLPGKVSDAYYELTDKVTDKKEWVEKRVELVGRGRSRRALKYIWKRLTKLLGKLAPKKGRAHLYLGLEDPADTGMAVGAYCFAYPLVGSWFFLTADYENERLDCEADMKGGIRIVHLVSAVLGIWFNRDFQYLKKQYEKL